MDLAGAPAGCLHFFHVLFEVAPHTTTVRTLADGIGILPSTLMSKFYRYKLPAPKHYLALARLAFAANLFENTGLSIAAVANHLDYSSPQSFGRHIRAFLQLTAVEFREQYDGEGMLQIFRERDVLPYLATLRRFDPTSAL
jgi:AraC-like DNA-binding protein